MHIIERRLHNYINVFQLPELICLLFTEYYTYIFPQKSAFHRPQTLEYRNGYPLPCRPSVGIGQDPLVSEQLLQQEISDLLFETSDITSSSFDQGKDEVFVPAYVALDKKVGHRGWTAISFHPKGGQITKIEDI